MIRYTKDYNKEIARVVKNYNAKIERLSKTNLRYTDFIPEKTTVSNVKSKHASRKTLNAELRRMKDFSSSNPFETVTLKGGETLPKFMVDTVRKESTTALRNITRELNRYKKSLIRVAGVSQGYTRFEMNDSHIEELEKYRDAIKKRSDKLKQTSKDSLEMHKIAFDISAEDFETLSKRVEAQINRKDKQLRFQSNYLEMLFDLAKWSGYPEEKQALIQKRLMDLDNNTFSRLFEEDEAIKRILTFYRLATNMPNAFSENKQQVHNLYDSLLNNMELIISNYE